MFRENSFVLKPAEAKKTWYVVDATDMVLGRLATQIADVLRGKTKSTYTPNTDSGDFVVVTNCEKVRLTGKKWEKKEYFWHTNHIGGIKKRTAKEQLQKHPEQIITEAVKGMLPKTTLGRKQLTKLKVCVGAEHGHEAQKPLAMKVTE